MCRRPYILTVLTCFAVLASGCASMVLPSEKEQQKSKWNSFEDVKISYTSVEPHSSTFEDLRNAGFDPQTMPNITTLSYLDAINRFSAMLKKEDLPPGIQACIAAQDGCKAYLAQISSISRDRVGNVAADLFGFRQQTKVTGWRFEAMFLLVDDIVVYKLWSGTPAVEEYGTRTKPLGPIQDLSDFVL